jgi:hypothetical protein
MDVFARGRVLPLLVLLFAILQTLSARAEYWRAPLPDNQYIICADGFTCARVAQTAYYGTNLIYGACYYVKNTKGQISVASCPGWTNNASRWSRYGSSKLYCETGEVQASEGCVKARPRAWMPCATLPSPIRSTRRAA